MEIETSRVKERASEQCRAIKWNTSDGGGVFLTWCMGFSEEFRNEGRSSPRTYK